MNTKLDRRTVLRGVLGGSAVSVGLPMLEMFLNSNGTALANGGELPVRFGVWFQNLGLNPGMWVPEKVGAGYENNTQLTVFDEFKDRMNIFSGLKVSLDGRSHETHTSSVEIAVTGIYGGDGQSHDSAIADVIGQRTRFRSLEVSLAGGRRGTSRRSGAAINPMESSPASFYTRIFGDEFQDPNAADFKPDPLVMARKSVLSPISERRRDLDKKLSASDRQLLDGYFTGLREMEQKLARSLEKPAPMPSCSVPGQVTEKKTSSLMEDVAKNAPLFGRMLAYAIACDQVRVFTIDVGAAGLRHAGNPMAWHTATHEESTDLKLGYQKQVYAYIESANKIFVQFLRELDSVKEGPTSVLNQTMVLWQTDHGDARNHSLENVPSFTVGSAGGRFKTGLHLNLPADPYTRVPLTIQQAMGVPLSSWGERSNTTSKTITEMLT